jgi:hypothetical protein
MERREDWRRGAQNLALISLRPSPAGEVGDKLVKYTLLLALSVTMAATLLVLLAG